MLAGGEKIHGVATARPETGGNSKDFEFFSYILPPKPLSSRKVEVLELLARGKSNRQVAADLSISIGTVKNHVHHILEKLGVSDRAHAAILALEHDLISV